MKRNEQNDKDLKALFSAEIELPDSLSTENVKSMVREHNVKQFKKKKHVLPKVLAAAAAVAIVVRPLPANTSASSAAAAM